MKRTLIAFAAVATLVGAAHVAAQAPTPEEVAGAIKTLRSIAGDPEKVKLYCEYRSLDLTIMIENSKRRGVPDDLAKKRRELLDALVAKLGHRRGRCRRRAPT